MPTLALRILFAVYLVVMGFVVWSPQPDAAPFTGVIAILAHWLEPLGFAFEPTYTVLEILANVVMFVPFGVFVVLLFPRVRVWSTTLAGLATSALIEGVQLFLPTRFSTVSDLIANTTGALLGALAVAVIRAVVRRGATDRTRSVEQ